MDSPDAVVARPIKAVCKRRGVGRTTIYSEIARGRLRAFSFCGRTLITDADETEWWERYARPIPPKTATGAPPDSASARNTDICHER